MNLDLFDVMLIQVFLYEVDVRVNYATQCMQRNETRI
jgi:hypothetical protein